MGLLRNGMICSSRGSWSLITLMFSGVRIILLVNSEGFLSEWFVVVRGDTNHGVDTNHGWRTRTTPGAAML